MSTRPYRIWDPQLRAPVRWRCYVHALRAHEAILKLLYPSKTIGQVLEVINSDSGRLLAQYKRRVDGIAFYGANNAQRRISTKKDRSEQDPQGEVLHAYSTEQHSARPGTGVSPARA